MRQATSNPNTTPDKLAKMGKTIAEQALAMAEEEFLTCLFICMADNK